MKSWIAPRLIALTGAGLIVASFALKGCTAESSASMGAASVTGTESGSKHCASVASSHTFVLKDSEGREVRLAYCPGDGWRYLDSRKAGDTERNLSFEQVSLSPLPPAHAQDDLTSEGNASRDGHPMAVFIDGPTGYTFAFTDGWRFIGRISDEGIPE